MKRESVPGPLLIVKWAYNGDAGPPSNGRAPRPPQCGPSQTSDGGRPTSNWFSSRGPRRANHVRNTHIFTPPYPPKPYSRVKPNRLRVVGPQSAKRVKSARSGEAPPVCGRSNDRSLLGPRSGSAVKPAAPRAPIVGRRSNPTSSMARSKLRRRPGP